MISEEDNRESLEKKIITAGCGMLVKFLNNFEKISPCAYPQPDEGISYTGLFKKEDMVIDWKKSCREILNKIRAFGFSPGCTTTLKGKTIKILKAAAAGFDPSYSEDGYKPGEIVKADRSGLIVMCGNNKRNNSCSEINFLKIEILKPQAKSSMDYLNFLNGYKIKPGDFFE